MAKKTAGQSHKPGRQPSRAEQEAFTRLLARLTPSETAHEEYRFQTNACLDSFGSALRLAPQGDLRSLRFRRSELFNGREYLVAYVDDNWLHRIAPDCDAIFSPMTGQSELGLQLSPLVYLPESKRRARNNVFRSIIEHEFVHLNQALQGTYPVLPAERNAGSLLNLFWSQTASEYEASFLQFVQWPEVIPAVAADLSLDHWCFLRGYSQALEHVLLAAAELNFPALEVEGFLNELSVSLSDDLQRIGATVDVASWFPPLFTNHLLIALQNVIAFHPSTKEHPAFRSAGLWLRARLEEV